MTQQHRIRFRLWHLFGLIAIASLAVWSFTQIGVVTAEFEIIEVDAWEQTEDLENNDPNRPPKIIKLVFQYVRPGDLATTRLNLFLRGPTETTTRIQPGDRFTFRYRQRPFLWLTSNRPDPIALQRIGLDRDDIEEVISEFRMPE
jgi:hypothetical protein